MADMLVRLYALPPPDEAIAGSAQAGVTIRRALAAERAPVIEWVRSHWPRQAAEVDAAFERTPVTCFLALRGAAPVGFACYDVTRPNFFGPEAVLEAERGRGIGRALLLATLDAQRAQGYAYAIVGGVGPAEFYAKTVGAIPIPGSAPGIYAGTPAGGSAQR